jgi:hypothetical protein
VRAGEAPGWLSALRRKRWAHLCIVNLRFLIGFAFLPAALKKILDEPFTDPAYTGRFHDFLDAFHATGWFYQAVGVVQLIAAALLCTQRFALLGAFVALPVLTAITAFCWSTLGVAPTTIVATLMLLGTIALVMWDVERWRGVIVETHGAPAPVAIDPAPVELRRWQWCGVAIFALYLGLCVVHGGIYRPRGMALGDPKFYVLPAIALLPVITLVLDARARRR